MKRVAFPGMALLGTVALLCGCKPDKPNAAQDPVATAQAVTAAEQAVRGDVANGPKAQFRGEQSYDQAMPDRRAVCGQVSPYADDQALFVPFVAVMQRDKAGRWSSTPDMRFVGTSVADADRTYSALVVHCYNKGGPSDGPLQSVAPLPPMPNQIPRPAAPVTQTTTAAAPGAVATPGIVAAPTATPAGGSVTLRQNANLHATPQGASTRVVPQGTALRVFATAPGGWVQVGDEAPWGWVHQSMLDGVAR